MCRMKHPHLTRAENLELVQQPKMAEPGTEAWTHFSECDECLVSVAEACLGKLVQQ
jgi:hypothetical protein